MWSKKVVKTDELPEVTPASETGRLRGRVPAHLRDAGLAESARWSATLNQAKTRAEELLAKAHEEADALVAQATAESEAIRNQACEEGQAQGHREGYEAGYAEGLAAGRAELLEHLHTVYQLADEAATAKAAVITAAETEILELVVEVARKVIGEVVELNPDVVTNVVANAIQHANTGDMLTIRVNPRDVELLREYWAQAVGDNPGNPLTSAVTSTVLSTGLSSSKGSGRRRRWEIVADRRVKPGGCVIDTESGTVDARIDTQLAQIKHAFKPETAVRDA